MAVTKSLGHLCMPRGPLRAEVTLGTVEESMRAVFVRVPEYDCRYGIPLSLEARALRRGARG